MSGMSAILAVVSGRNVISTGVAGVCGPAGRPRITDPRRAGTGLADLCQDWLAGSWANCVRLGSFWQAEHSSAQDCWAFQGERCPTGGYKAAPVECEGSAGRVRGERRLSSRRRIETKRGRSGTAPLVSIWPTPYSTGGCKAAPAGARQAPAVCPAPRGRHRPVGDRQGGIRP